MFTGRISAVGGQGTVSYRFQQSDGGSNPVQVLKFDGPGSQDITRTWTLGGPGFTYSGWELIEVLDPQNLQSEKASFSVKCS